MNFNPSLLEPIINAAWDDRADLTVTQSGETFDAIQAVITALDNGFVRIASKDRDGCWHVHEWLKKAVLLSFRIMENCRVHGGPGQDGVWWDKVPSKFEGWSDTQFKHAGFRLVPPAAVRRGAFIAPNAVIMPSYINIGAYIDEGSMIDTWSTIGSCAQIGKNVHISGGVGIGGVLEPLQAQPVIIEDQCFIGARAEVAEGVVVREGAVLAMGVFLSASTKIIDRQTGAVTYGEVPPYSVVVPGNVSASDGGVGLYCAVIVKRVDAKTRAKTSINELLRA